MPSPVRLSRARVGVALLVIATSPLAPASLRAQLPTSAPAAAPTVFRLAVVVANGRVHLYPGRVPADGEGWVYLRDGVRLTRTPVTGVQGPAEFAAAVGSDLQLLLEVTGTDTSLGAYRRLRGGGTASGIAQILSPRAAAALGALYVDSTAAPGSLHTYAAELVRLARPDSVLRRAAASVRVATMPIAAPAAPTARVTDDAIAVSWSVPRFTGASDDIIVAYTVERADSTGEFRRVSALPVMRLAADRTEYRDDEAQPSELYRYRVRAADMLGRLSAPSAAVALRAPATRGPVPPPQVAADVTDGRIRLVWTISPEPRTVGYHVERSVGGDSSFTRVTRTPIAGDQPEFVDSLVRGRQIYSYRVRAVDAAGRVGAPSNPTTTRALDERPPAAPGELAVALLDGHRVRLTWRAVADRDVRGYEVRRAEPNDTVFATLTPVPIRAVQFVDAGYDGSTLEPGREYTWRVVAVDSSGNVSVPAEKRFKLVDDEAPDPVRSILVHNELGRRVDISWTGSPSRDIAHYIVERVAAGATPATAPVVVATVGVREEFSARDTTVLKGQLMRWRVIAVDSAGNRSAPRSDTLTFRDLTKPPAPRRATAILTGGVTTLQWERVVSADLRGYVIYRAERTDGPRTRVTSVPATTREYLDRAASAGTRWFVRAVDASGNESDESPVAVTVERP
jgi:fibronectin type 3 domain-containing protein